MNLELVSPKHVNELELKIGELLALMRKAKVQPEPLSEQLRLLEQELGKIRRERFDATNSEYNSYG